MAKGVAGKIFFKGDVAHHETLLKERGVIILGHVKIEEEGWKCFEQCLLSNDVCDKLLNEGYMFDVSGFDNLNDIVRLAPGFKNEQLV